MGLRVRRAYRIFEGGSSVVASVGFKRGLAVQAVVGPCFSFHGIESNSTSKNGKEASVAGAWLYYQPVAGSLPRKISSVEGCRRVDQ